MKKKSQPKPADKYAGDRVRTRRLALGMSQTELGQALGITFQQVQKYEKGTNRISTSRLQQIANILEVPIMFFFEERAGTSEDAARPDYLAKFLLMRDGHALAQSFAAIRNAKLRAQIVKLAALLAGESDED
jgi:transcriptional regulator with XRE-family HTH domain